MTNEQQDQPNQIPHRSNKVSGVYIAITVIIGVVALLAGSGIGYAIGNSTKHATHKSGELSNMRSSEGARFGNRKEGVRHMGNMGTVDTVSDSSLTIKTKSGSTRTYKITSDTTVTNNGDKAKVSDIKTGDTVMVRTDGKDGDTAKSIRIGEMPLRADSEQQSTDAN